MNRRQFLKWGGATLFTTSLAGVGYAWQSNLLAVESYQKKILNLSQPLRLGVVSDLHAPNFVFSIEKLISEVSRAKCDALAIVGDTVDQKDNEVVIKELFKPLIAPAGKFAVLGNWEYSRNINRRKLEAFYSVSDVQLLVNAETRLSWGDLQLRIIGLDDFLRGAPDYGLIEHSNTQPVIVLSHCPVTAHDIASRSNQPQLILSGHTHGGQIAPFGIPLHLPPGSGGFVKGWYQIRQSEMYVSPGLGNRTLPFRIGSKPTFTVIDLT